MFTGRILVNCSKQILYNSSSDLLFLVFVGHIFVIMTHSMMIVTVRIFVYTTPFVWLPIVHSGVVMWIIIISAASEVISSPLINMWKFWDKMQTYILIKIVQSMKHQEKSWELRFIADTWTILIFIPSSFYSLRDEDIALWRCRIGLQLYYQGQ